MEISVGKCRVSAYGENIEWFKDIQLDFKERLNHFDIAVRELNDWGR